MCCQGDFRAMSSYLVARQTTMAVGWWWVTPMVCGLLRVYKGLLRVLKGVIVVTNQPVLIPNMSVNFVNQYRQYQLWSNFPRDYCCDPFLFCNPQPSFDGGFVAWRVPCDGSSSVVGERVGQQCQLTIGATGWCLVNWHQQQEISLSPVGDKRLSSILHFSLKPKRRWQKVETPKLNSFRPKELILKN